MWAPGDDPAVAAEVVGGLGPALVDLVRRFDTGPAGGPTRTEREYLLVTARVAGPQGS